MIESHNKIGATSNPIVGSLMLFSNSIPPPPNPNFCHFRQVVIRSHNCSFVTSIDNLYHINLDCLMYYESLKKKKSLKMEIYII